jgi:glutathione synthase/RimK-type ligase-like ATP-grasp enzyme
LKIAFVTSREDGLTQDDRAALAPLGELGIAVEPWVWDGPDGSPRGFDMLVLRSCWDYHRKHCQFERWIKGLSAVGAPVWNPVQPILWNLNKKYLLDLAAKGVRLPPTRWLPQGSRVSDDDARLDLGAASVVVKPAVSLNGFDTALFAARDRRSIRRAAEAILADRDLLIQEFVPEIETAGETSLVFFDGEFSHAIRKTPRSGEFRVQAEHGGSRAAVRPDAAIIAQAEHILKLAGPPLLYARVDGVEIAGELVLMELEIIDPTLFLASDEDAAGRFARAVHRRLARPGGL